MTDPVWRQQAEAEFNRALDDVQGAGVRVSVAGSLHAALHAALDRAEPLIREAERERMAGLLAAYHNLYDTWWNKTATVDIAYPGHNGITYAETVAMDKAAEAIERLLVQAQVTAPESECEAGRPEDG